MGDGLAVACRLLHASTLACKFLVTKDFLVLCVRVQNNARGGECGQHLSVDWGSAQVKSACVRVREIYTCRYEEEEAI